MKTSTRTLHLILSSLLLAIFLLTRIAPFPALADSTSTTTASSSLSLLPASDTIQGGIIAFQGTLNDASGNPVPDGLYNLDFKIYDAPTNGNLQWEESYTGDQRIQVTGGSFSVSLGESVPLNLDFNDAAYYLAVTVGGMTDVPAWDTEMTPRKEIITVEQLLQQAQSDGTSVLNEFISDLDSGNNMVVIVDSATMASLLSSLEQQAGAQASATTSASISSASNGGGILATLAGFFVSMFESIQGALADLGHSMAQSLVLLNGISQKVDQIYQAVAVDNQSVTSSASSASLLPIVTSLTNAPSQQSGSAVILANQQSVNIATAAIESSSSVLITLVDGSNQSIIPQTNWTISNRVAGEYFTLEFNAPVASDTVINWWVLNGAALDELTTSSAADAAPPAATPMLTTPAPPISMPAPAPTPDVSATSNAADNSNAAPATSDQVTDADAATTDTVSSSVLTPAPASTSDTSDASSNLDSATPPPADSSASDTPVAPDDDSSQSTSSSSATSP